MTDLRNQVSCLVRDGRAYVTINCPDKRNALTYERFGKAELRAIVSPLTMIRRFYASLRPAVATRRLGRP